MVCVGAGLGSNLLCHCVLICFFMRFGYGILGPWLEGKGSGMRREVI